MIIYFKINKFRKWKVVFFLVNMYNKMSNSAGMRVQIFDHILVLNGTLWQKKSYLNKTYINISKGQKFEQYQTRL